MNFISASTVSEENRIVIREPLYSQLDGLISHLTIGSLVVIESDSLRKIHEGIHAVMIDAYSMNFKVQYVDVANAFDPHSLSSFDHTVLIDDVLKNINLSRPFQHFQSVSIINTLITNLLHFEESHQLILVTGMDSQIQENEDELQIQEQLIHILGGLQNISVKGNIVIVTNQLNENHRHIFSAFASTHLLCKGGTVVLKKHPFEEETGI